MILTANDIILIISAFVLPYLISSVNFSIIIGRIYLKDDIRNYGSKNAGMTNVLRTIGKKAAFYIIVSDTLKGILPTLLFKYLFSNYSYLDPIFGAYIAGFSALLGHIFPVYYRFKGGKGILVSAGMVISIDIQVFFILLIVFLILVFSTKIISVGSIGISILYPFVSYFLQYYQNRFTIVNLYCTIVFSIVILFMHRSNIKRLLNGEENKLSNKKIR